MDPRLLDPAVRGELRGLGRDLADRIARHLVAAGQLIDDDPQGAWEQARAARDLAPRLGIVREAAGMAAHAAGDYAQALSELRAARRITGQAAGLAVMADCERAIGRPERALALASHADVARIDEEERVELQIVLSGARRDLGEPEAAVRVLVDLARGRTRAWSPRVWYALAAALEEAGRPEEAASWFRRVVEADAEATDAAERLASLPGGAPAPDGGEDWADGDWTDLEEDLEAEGDGDGESEHPRG